jgi:NAD(P)-dependent dehydrogenase (short-subunit alcohol dehydrogenase family)
LADGAAVTHHRAIDPHPGRAARRRGARLISSEETLVRIIAVGGAGTIGRAVVELLSARHEVVVAGRTSGDVQVDIGSPDSVRLMYEQVGRFDALVCTAGEAHFGPFETATEDELALGVHSKLLGQIRLVLLGRSQITDGGSFTLVSGYIFDDPIPEAVSFAVANGGVEGFVRSAALSLGRAVRINAVSPGMAQDSSEQFSQFNPGRTPVPMPAIAAAFQRSVEGWRTGEIIRAW